MSFEPFEGNDRFEVRSRLGEGTYGVVYEVFDREREGIVALKTLHRTDPTALYRLKQEFRANAGLTHPNLVQLYELLSDGERWFFTMELVEGRDFVTEVRESVLEKTLDARDTGSSWPVAGAFRPLARQLAEGLHTLHRAGKIHRDIKPSNVLVTRDGRVVILDFGLFTETASRKLYESMQDSIVGTPAYMSPEQGAGLSVGEASDWYSVGALFYESLTGRPPFSGNFVSVMLEKQREEPAPPQEIVREIPDDLNSLCRRLLRRDPQERPTGVEVLDFLGVTEPSAASWPSSSGSTRPGSDLVGRESHLEELRDAFETMRGGEAVTVFVHGASGLGKTALVERFLRDIRHQDPELVLLTGRCYENESVPYKAFDTVVDTLSRYLRQQTDQDVEILMPRDILALARLFPVLRRVEAVVRGRRQVLEIPDSRELRRRATAALRDLLARLATRHPLVVFIDDLQWGDADSAALLSSVMHPPDPPPLLLIGAYRDEDVTTSPLLRALAEREGTDSPPLDARSLPVEELSAEAGRELALELMDDPDDEVARVVSEEAGGNPFFIAELVHHLEHGGALSRPDPESGERQAAFGSLDDALRTRVRRLPSEARRLLEVLAVASQPIDLAGAASVADIDGDEQTTFAQLRVAKLARASGSRRGERVETYHDRIREAVLGGLDADRLREAHLRLAIELETAPDADPETLAHHFAAGGEPGQASAYSARAAGRAAEALAFDRAARLFALALEVDPGDEEDRRRELRRGLGDALVNAGRGAEAAAVYLRAADGARAADALEFRRLAAEQLLISGHIDEGIAALQDVLASVGLKLFSTPRRALVSYLFRKLYLKIRGRRFKERDSSQISAETLTRIDTCWSAAIGLGIVDTIRASAFQAQHLLLALRAGEPYRIARALAVQVGYSASRGGENREQTRRLIRETFELVVRSDEPHALGLATMTAGLAAYLEGRWRRGRERLEEAEEILRSRCTGVAWELDNAHFYQLRSLVYLGDVDELHRRLPKLVKEARDRGDLYALTNFQTRISWLVHLFGDEVEAARLELEEARRNWTQEGFHLQHFWTLSGEAECDLYVGDGETAWSRLEERWPELQSSLLLRIQSTRIESAYLHGRAAIARAAGRADDGERDALLARAAADARTILGEGMAWGEPLARALQAGVAVSRGEVGDALEHLTSAEAGFANADMELHANAVRLRRAGSIGGSRGRELAGDARRWMASQDIAAPDRIAATLVPGPWGSSQD